MRVDDLTPATSSLYELPQIIHDVLKPRETCINARTRAPVIPSVGSRRPRLSLD